MRHIVVVGCGFAGYHAAQKLESSLVGRRRVRLTIISDGAHFVFTPLLPAVATGQLAADQVMLPLDEAFTSRTRLVVAPVTSLDLKGRHLIAGDEEIDFDYLLIATGGRRGSALFEGASSLLGPDQVGDALTIGDELRRLWAREKTPRFAVIGASSTGVEWAAELAAATARREYPPPAVHLFEAGDRLLPDHSRRISARAQQDLEALGIAIHLNHRITAATPTSVDFADQPPQSFDAVYHCAGRYGQSLWADSDLPRDHRGRLNVTDRLEVVGTTGIYAAGDAATAPAQTPQATNPQVAVQQGRWAAKNLLAHMSGRSKKPFDYEDRGDFITLGRGQALLDLKGIILEGKAAWLAYRLYYMSMMPQPIQKARLLVDSIARRITSESAPHPSLPESDAE